MSDLEKQLRDEEARVRRERDPGDLFWARLPGQVYAGLEAAQARSRRRMRLVRRASVALGVVAAAAAAVLWATHPRAPVSAPPVEANVWIEPQNADEAPWLLDAPALDRLAAELDRAAPQVSDETATDDLPIEALLDRMSESELRALAERLRG